MAKNHTLTKPSDKEIVVTWTVDAPREVVYQAYSDPNLIPKWWGPRKYITTIEKMDVRPGGKWRFLQRDAEGNKYAFNGEYREVKPPERMVQTFEFEGMPGHVQVDTLSLEAQGGKTKVTTHSQFANVEDRDGMLQSGMEEGMAEGIDRLAELVQEMQRA
jgi:uncharacterized protein YndB with AHSA1/START domain